MTKDESSMLLSIKLIGAILALRKEDLKAAFSIVMDNRDNGLNNN